VRRRPTPSSCRGAEARSRFTRDFEDQAAYFAQVMDRTAASRLLRVAWRTVGQIIERVVALLGPADRLEGLEYIGIDELSYRRHHEYITSVVDHVATKVVWAAEGKSAATVDGFFEALGPERAAKLKGVTIDMSGAFIDAVQRGAPQAQIMRTKAGGRRRASARKSAVVCMAIMPNGVPEPMFMPGATACPAPRRSPPPNPLQSRTSSIQPESRLWALERPAVRVRGALMSRASRPSGPLGAHAAERHRPSTRMPAE
jgi:hypothetical protein